MTIAKRFTGDAYRSPELVRQNPWKPSVFYGRLLTFQDIFIGEELTLPPSWGHQGLGQGAEERNKELEHDTLGQLGQSAHPHEHALGQSATPAKKPCCSDCAKTGGTCGGKKLQGLGQGAAVPATGAMSGWGTAFVVGTAAVAAGFGLAYVVGKYVVN